MSDKNNNQDHNSTEELVFFAAEILKNEGPQNTKAVNREYAEIIINNVLADGRIKNIADLEHSCESLGVASKYVSGSHKLLKKKIGFLQESLLHFGPKHPFQTVKAVKNMALETKNSNSELFKVAVDTIQPFVKMKVFEQKTPFRQFLYKSVRQLSGKAMQDRNQQSMAPFLYKDIMLRCVDQSSLSERQELFIDAVHAVVDAEKDTPAESLFLNNAITVVDSVLGNKGALEGRKKVLADFEKNLKTVGHKVPKHLKIGIDLKRDQINQRLNQ